MESAQLAPDPLLKNVPPHSLEAERAVLGAVLLDPRAIDEVAGQLGPEDFYGRAHAQIFEVILELYRRDQPADVVLLNEELARRGVLDQVGGTATLAELCEVVPTSVNAGYYAKIVRDRAMQRRLIEVAAAVQKDAFETAGAVDELMDRAEAQFFAVTQKRIRSEAKPVAEGVKEALETLFAREKGAGVVGLPSGFDDLDELSGGFLPGEMTIIAARPSMGKTSFALNILKNVVLYRGSSAAFFSLEMPTLQVTSNMLCAIAKVDGHRLRGGFLNREEKRNFLNACEMLEPAHLFIDDTPSLSTMELRAKARRLKAQHDIELLAIDYLQLMTGSAQAAKQSRQIEVSEISRQVKALARELEIPILCLAQLSRKVEERKDRRPMMSDLRESGSIEQDADKIILLHRPEYYEPEKEELRGKAEIILAKNRNGPTGNVEMLFLRNQMRFESLARM
ncbi:MAG: replicative DNA helicase [Planctomycetota bacterium]|nr:MAG: replicative DNA helicase [Planctomycetota bacterium]